jgi:Flp pilus assembly protein TadG
VVEGALTLEAPAAPQAAGEPPRPHSAYNGLPARLWRSERGTAVVEFALVAPLLFVVLFGIIDFGRALNYYNNLTQIAGQGARAAAVNQNPSGGPPSGTSIQDALKSAVGSPELQKGITVCIPTVPASPGAPVTVTASFTFHFIPLVGKIDLPLSASQTVRSEASASTYSAGCSS